jgi:hypothetical protein
MDNALTEGKRRLSALSTSRMKLSWKLLRGRPQGRVEAEQLVKFASPAFDS